tara:strand:- start:88 stop:249 length:162 start_codon:yes stop_codon:yes gene_type:complete
MPNSKAASAKRKHKKRREKLREERQLNIGNAKKSTMRELNKNGTLPGRYMGKI